MDVNSYNLASVSSWMTSCWCWCYCCCCFFCGSSCSFYEKLLCKYLLAKEIIGSEQRVFDLLCSCFTVAASPNCALPFGIQLNLHTVNKTQYALHLFRFARKSSSTFIKIVLMFHRQFFFSSIVVFVDGSNSFSATLPPTIIRRRLRRFFETLHMIQWINKILLCCKKRNKQIIMEKMYSHLFDRQDVNTSTFHIFVS